MTDVKPTKRRDLMRPAQLLGLAFVSALITGVVTALSLGIAQTPSKPWMSEAEVAALRNEVVSNALVMSGIFAGVAFIVVLLILSMLLLAVKPSDFQEGAVMDRPTLLPEEDAKPAEGSDNK